MTLGENIFDFDEEWNDALVEEDSDDDQDQNIFGNLEPSPVNWSKDPPNDKLIEGSINYDAFTFIGPDPGPTGLPTTPLESFEQFLDDEILNLIINESNKETEKEILKCPSNWTKASSWYLLPFLSSLKFTARTT